MSNDNKPKDLENTIRIDTKEITDPYASPNPSSIDNIEDVFSASESSDIAYKLPEEAIISPEENVDLNDLNKEVNEISSEFEFNTLDEKAKEEVQTSETESKPIDKKVTEEISNTDKQEAPSSPSTVKQSIEENPDTLPSSKKEQQKSVAPVIPVETVETTTEAKKCSNGISVAMLFISLIALASGFTGAWVSMSLQPQVDSLYTELSAVHNNRSSYLHELTETQKQLAILKQELATLQLKYVASAIETKAKPVITVAVKKALPATITPTTLINEVKSTPHKNTWNVIISSHASIKKAKQQQQSKTISGMQTSIVAVVVKGKNWYRTVAKGFTSKQQAVNFTHKLKEQGIADAWIQRNK